MSHVSPGPRTVLQLVTLMRHAVDPALDHLAADLRAAEVHNGATEVGIGSIQVPDASPTREGLEHRLHDDLLGQWRVAEDHVSQIGRGARSGGRTAQLLRCRALGRSAPPTEPRLPRQVPTPILLLRSTAGRARWTGGCLSGLFSLWAGSAGRSRGRYRGRGGATVASLDRWSGARHWRSSDRRDGPRCSRWFPVTTTFRYSEVDRGS